MGDDFAMESFKIGGNALAHSLAKMSNLYLIPAKLRKYKYIYNIVKETLALNMKFRNSITINQ